MDVPVESFFELRGGESALRMPALARVNTRTHVEALDKVAPRGRFFFRDDKKFFLKGVTYGPFAVGSHGAPFPEAAVV